MSASPNDSTSVSWLAVGQDATQAFAASAAHFPAAMDNIANQPVFPSVLSQPVDITVAGSYIFAAGPVPADAPVNEASVSFPPDVNTHMVLAGDFIATPPNLVIRQGKTYVTFTLSVESVSSPYYGLRAWVL